MHTALDTQVILFISITCVVVLGKTIMRPFVVGGGLADIVDFPYSAHLGIECMHFENKESHCCGASIVNQRTLLTAAHCLFYCMEGTKITISFGHAVTHMGANTRAYSFLIHEEYVQQTADNDIALIMVATAIEFCTDINRVALMPKPPYNDEAVIAGWGLVNEKQHKTTEQLKFTTQQVVKRKDCLKVIKRLPNGTFCGKSLHGYASVGDSGSALVVRNYIQIGIVSFKKPGISESKVVYTDTGYFYKWIILNIEKLLCASK